MKPTDVPIKTDAGNRELGQRVHKLTSRARSLLIVIHGTETVADLSRTFHGFGDVDGSLNELAALGLIAARTDGVTLAATQMPAANASDILAPAQQAKQLLNESAVAVLGLRAFLFTLKLEHCYSVDELRGILPEYRRVVSKAKGGEAFAGAMAARAEAILRRS
jgi:hypothetical protein